MATLAACRSEYTCQGKALVDLLLEHALHVPDQQLDSMCNEILQILAKMTPMYPMGSKHCKSLLGR